MKKLLTVIMLLALAMYSYAENTISGTNDAQAGGNYVAVEADTTLRFVGDATYFDDVRVPLITTKLGGSQDPDFVTLTDGLKAYGFDQTLNEEAFFTMQMPHAWKNATSITAHVHWSPTNTDTTGGVVWALEYSWAGKGQAFPTSTIINASGVADTGNGTANEHIAYTLGTISGASIVDKSSMLNGRVFRHGAHVNDTYAADAILHEIDFHYEMDTIGSRTEAAK